MSKPKTKRARSNETVAQEATRELARPVWYRGENVCGQHLFSDCSPMVTHVFDRMKDGLKAFAGREMRDLPNI